MCHSCIILLVIRPCLTADMPGRACARRPWAARQLRQGTYRWDETIVLGRNSPSFSLRCSYISFDDETCVSLHRLALSCQMRFVMAILDKTQSIPRSGWQNVRHRSIEHGNHDPRSKSSGTCLTITAMVLDRCSWMLQCREPQTCRRTQHRRRNSRKGIK